MFMAGSEYRGREDKGAIGIANQHANEAAARWGEAGILRGTSGCIYDEEGHFVMLPVVQETYKKLTSDEIAPYTMGPKAYLDGCVAQCFGASRPEGYIAASPTPGSTGALHHAICGYTEEGDTVLTSDWHWGSYENLTHDNKRKLAKFSLLTEEGTFNLKSFRETVLATIAGQNGVEIILNSPANNPTGYSLSESEWDGVISVLKEAAETGKKVIFVSDVAYIDYAGEKEECRRFFKKFGGLPANVLILVAYTMSKGFTLYGQRAGALIAVSSDKEVTDEFLKVCGCMNKCTWGSCSFAPMNAMIRITGDAAALAELDKERRDTFQMIAARAAIFTEEAKQAGLKMLPYLCGFFITVPMEGDDRVCELLEKEKIFLVPIGGAIRIAICSIPKAKVYGLAGAIKKAVDAAGAKQ